jgi:hypothetical protein
MMIRIDKRCLRECLDVYLLDVSRSNTEFGTTGCHRWFSRCSVPVYIASRTGTAPRCQYPPLPRLVTKSKPPPAMTICRYHCIASVAAAVCAN